MTGLLLLTLLLAPKANEPAGGAGSADPLGRRVWSLVAGAPVFRGNAVVVPLHARTPGEAGDGQPLGIDWANGDLRARFLVEDGRGYLRVVNPRHGPLFLAAGTLFSSGAAEVAVSRGVVVPGDFAALVPADALGAAGALDLALAGALPPLRAGSLLAGGREETLCLPMLANRAVGARRDRLASDLGPALREAQGTAVGAVFLVGDRPVAAHVFGRHDVFVAAMPDLLLGLAADALEEESRRPPAARQRPTAAEARRTALAWPRAITAPGVGHVEYGETRGAELEVLVTAPMLRAIGHAVIDSQGTLFHAGFYAIPSPSEGEPPPPPPKVPDDPPPGGRPTPETPRKALDPGAPVAPLATAGPSNAPADPALVPPPR